MSKSPDAFRTISEVAAWLGVQAHVLRFWESKFSQIKPVKRAGGRRYYRPADMRLIGGIKTLLHDDGMTIKGVQKILREQGVAHVSALSPPLDGEAVESQAQGGGTVVSFKAKDSVETAPQGLDHTGAGPDDEAPETGTPERPSLPSFLTPSEKPMQPAPHLPLKLPEMADPRAAPHPIAPEEDTPPYSPGPLGHLAGLPRLSARQAAEIAPLARALQDWYDRNAKAGWG